MCPFQPAITLFPFMFFQYKEIMSFPGCNQWLQTLILFSFKLHGTFYAILSWGHPHHLVRHYYTYIVSDHFSPTDQHATYVLYCYLSCYLHAWFPPTLFTLIRLLTDCPTTLSTEDMTFIESAHNTIERERKLIVNNWHNWKQKDPIRIAIDTCKTN